MKRNRITVKFSRPESRWVVTDGHVRVLLKTKAEAVRVGSDAGKIHAPSQLVVFNKNGRIQEERTYGADPERTRD